MPGHPSSNGFEGTPATRDEVLAVLETFAGRLAYSPDVPGFDVPKEGTSYPRDFEVLADEHPEARWFLLSPERSEVLAAEREAEVEAANEEAYRQWARAHELGDPDVIAKPKGRAKLGRWDEESGDWKFEPLSIVADDSEADRFATKSGVVSVRLSAVRAEAVNWHVEGLVPKVVHTVLAAPGGTGKGLFYLWLFGHHIDGRVLFFNSEDDHALMLRPRLEAAGIDPDRVVPIFGNDRERPGVIRPLRFPSDAEVLKRAIAQHGAEAIVVDSGVEFMDEGLAANKAEDVRQVTAMFNDVSRATRVLPLDILHTNKNRDARGVERVGHAKTWTDASRHVLMMAVDDVDENVRHVEVVKTNIGRKGEGRQFRVKFRDVEVYNPETDRMELRPVPYFEDEGPSTKSVEELLSAKASTDDPEAIDRSILAALIEAGGTMPSTALDKATAETQSCSPRTASNHRKGLAKRGLVRSSPGERDDSGTVARWDVIITDAGREEADRMGGPPDDGPSADW